jgi:hypothetical protein
MPKIERWIDARFHSVVPPLALVGCITVSSFGGASWIAGSMTLFLRVAGAIGCWLWAIDLRKKKPALWLLLGVIPMLPQCYLLGWHRARREGNRESEQSPPLDCPRCGMFMDVGASGCPNCSWKATPQAEPNAGPEAAGRL